MKGLCFLKNEKGQGMVEYILIVVLIAIVAYVAFQQIGDVVLDEGSNAANEIEAIASS